MFTGLPGFQAAIVCALLAGAYALIGPAGLYVGALFVVLERANTLVFLLAGIAMAQQKPRATFSIEPFIWPDGKMPAELEAALAAAHAAGKAVM